MALYAIRRTWPPESLNEDSEMAHVRVIAGSWAEPRFTWVRSFGREVSGGAEGVCVYEGYSERELAIQQQLCGMPVDEIRMVEEVSGAARGNGIDEVPDGWAMYWAERRFGTGSSPSSVLQANAPYAEGADNVLWLRSFWDGSRNKSLCIFAAASPSAVEAAVRNSSAEVDRFAEVGTDHPALWAHIYDRLGIPRHWEEPLEPAVP